MTAPLAIAVLGTMFAWWFSTGAILWRVRRADLRGGGAHLRSVIYAAPLLGFGTWGFWVTLNDAGLAGAAIAPLSAILLWGWIEIALLSGVISGPNTRPLPAAAAEWERFIRAWGTIAYHEMLLAATFAAMAVAASGAPNRFGLLTFGVLLVARVSAKLNLFFGVPRIHSEFLPRTLLHLPSHFRIRRLNWLFPLSITALSLATGHWIDRIIGAGTPAETVGFAILATLTGLALLEHWLMVLPLPDERLWRWMLPAPEPRETNGLTRRKI